MHHFYLVSIAFFFFTSIVPPTALAQTATQIDIQIEDYAARELCLAYFHGDKQILKDTLYATSPQRFAIQTERPLKAGVYMLVLAPEQKRMVFIVPEEDQKFSIQLDTSLRLQRTKFKGSQANELYYQYLSEKEKQEEALSAFETWMTKTTESTDDVHEQKRTALVQDQEVFRKWQETIVAEQAGTMLADLIRMDWEIKPPSYEDGLLPEEEFAVVQQHHKDHYFDFIALDAPHFLKLPGAYQKVDYFINGLYTAGISPLSLAYPEAIKTALTQVLDRMRNNPKVFKFYLTHFINKYGKAKVVGMDAVFVHLAEQYVLTGAASWIKDGALKTVKTLASKRKPLLNGKIAPNITMQLENGASIALHDVEATYTVLIFWRPNCGHCKKAIPAIKDFYEAHREEGVKVFAACTWIENKTPKCWADMKDKDMGDFINVVDPKLQSNFLKLYDIKTTPSMFLLDKDKRILIKKIASEELEPIFQKLKALP